MTIVGVAERGFDGTTLGFKPRLFAPITMRGFSQPFKGFDNRRSYWAYVFARLKPGVSIDQAKVALGAQYHDCERRRSAAAKRHEPADARALQGQAALDGGGGRGQSDVRSEAKAPLMLLFGVTAFVLIIACANIANLLLARSASRAAEMAVRLSIGAGRDNRFASCSANRACCALFGGAGGLLVAQWTLNLMASLLPSDAANTIDFSIDWRMMLFAAALALGTGMLFGLFPAVHSTRPDLVSALKGQSGQPSGARSASRFRTSLATTQIALSMALLVSAGLFARSLFNVSRVHLGLKADNIVMFAISPELNGYKPEQSRQLFERVEDELQRAAGRYRRDERDGAAARREATGATRRGGGLQRGPGHRHNSRFNEIGPGYFSDARHPAARRARLHARRRAGAPKVAIVNEAFAKKFNLGRDAVVGKRIGDAAARTPDSSTMEIVGLVQNAKYSDGEEGDSSAVLPARTVRTNALGVHLLLRAGGGRPRSVPGEHPEGDRAARRQSAGRESARRCRSRFARTCSSIASSACCRRRSRRSRRCSRRSASTACWPTRCRSARGRSACAWRSAPRRGACARMVMRQVGVMTLVGGVIGLAAAVGLGRSRSRCCSS